MSTYENIKFYSKKRGLSLPQLSEKIGMNPNSMYGYNQGKEPRYSTLKKISTVLDVPISKLSNKYKDEKADETPTADIDDFSTVMRFQGQEIPEEDRETIMTMLESLRRARKEKDDK